MSYFRYTYFSSDRMLSLEMFAQVMNKYTDHELFYIADSNFEFVNLNRTILSLCWKIFNRILIATRAFRASTILTRSAWKFLSVWYIFGVYKQNNSKSITCSNQLTMFLTGNDRSLISPRTLFDSSTPDYECGQSTAHNHRTQLMWGFNFLIIGELLHL